MEHMKEIARDHPRMCGEHIVTNVVVLGYVGSSPHVRGALAVLGNRHVTGGIIPACAGSTVGMSDWCRFHWDHPRMCGEHPPRRPRLSHDSGSSPHVRGALDYPGPVNGNVGIIPACAGSTNELVELVVLKGDHPRMCGEHLRNNDNPVDGRGSSPHVRGARACRACL